MRKLRQVKAWVSDFTCTQCKAKITMHHGVLTKKDALVDVPTYDPKIHYSGTWNGWFVGKKGGELCWRCYGKKH
jgi:hypothetical protein